MPCSRFTTHRCRQCLRLTRCSSQCGTAGTQSTRSLRSCQQGTPRSACCPPAAAPASSRHTSQPCVPCPSRSTCSRVWSQQPCCRPQRSWLLQECGRKRLPACDLHHLSKVGWLADPIRVLAWHRTWRGAMLQLAACRCWPAGKVWMVSHFQAQSVLLLLAAPQVRQVTAANTPPAAEQQHTATKASVMRSGTLCAMHRQLLRCGARMRLPQMRSIRS